jgi:putative lipoprotein
MNRWIALVLLALACGCGSINSNREPPPKPFTATKWMLIMEVPLPGDPPYIRFGDGILEGYGGCSHFVGRYVQDAVGARAIAIGRLEIDRRLCDPMQRLAEARTLEVLQAVSSYSVTVDILTMSGSGGTLRFRAADAMPGAAPASAAPASAAPASAAPSSSLVGTRWKGVVDGADEGTTPWLEFAEGRVQGYTGCNMLSGPWHMEANQLRIGPLATTKRACAGPGGEIERRLLSAMNELAHVARQGDRLVASGSGGDRFEFSEVR